jgi:hypothetical protein
MSDCECITTWKEPGTKQVAAHLKHYSSFCLENRKETVRCLSQDSQPPDLNSKSGIPECEARMLSTRNVRWGG